MIVLCEQDLILLFWVLHRSFFMACTGENGLEMTERLDIAIDIAHAVAYLHTYSGTCSDPIGNGINTKQFIIQIELGLNASQMTWTCPFVFS